MPGFPCCCIMPNGGIWDMYNGDFSPYFLDLRTWTNLRGFTNRQFLDELYFLFLHQENGKSFNSNIEPRLPKQNITNVDSWYVNQINPTNSGLIPRMYNRNLITSFFPVSWLDTAHAINTRNLTNETVFGIVNEIQTGTKVAASNLMEAIDFNTYQELFATSPTDRYGNDGSYHNATRVENFHRNYRRGFEGVGDNSSFIVRDLMDFRITGIYGGAPPVSYSNSYVRYVKDGNPTITENWHNLYGVGDEYPGSSAFYNTGDGRYSVDQPFFTGLMSRIIHSIDLPAQFWVDAPSVSEGWINAYTGLPTTGVYLALYGYWDSITPFGPEYWQTGIHSTGSESFYVNDVRNNLANSPKFLPPLSAEILINESTVDTLTGTPEYRFDRYMMEVNLSIKPDEIRNFMITWNPRSLSNEHRHRRDRDFFGADVENGFYISILPNGELYSSRIIDQDEYSLMTEPMISYSVDSSGFYNISYFKVYNTASFNNSIGIDQDWPDTTGEPTVTYWGSIDVGDRPAYEIAYKQRYSDLRDFYLTGVDPIMQTGYLPYCNLHERSLHIYPFSEIVSTTQDSSDATLGVGYFGTSGDGFWIKDAQVSLYDAGEYYTAMTVTDVVNKTFQNTGEYDISAIRKQTVSDIEGSGLNALSDNIEIIFSSTSTSMSYLPTVVQSWDDNKVNILDYKPNAVIGLNNIIRNSDQIIRGPNPTEVVLETGTSAIGGVLSFLTTFEFPHYFLEFDVTGNFYDLNPITAINRDCFHFADKLVNKDINAINDVDNIIPAVLKDRREPRSLVISPHDNCLPRIYVNGDDSSDVSAITGVSYDWYLSSNFDVSGIDKYNRAGPLNDAANDAGIGLTHSYESWPFAIPTADIYMGTTTIERPSSGIYSQTGTYNITITGVSPSEEAGGLQQILFGANSTLGPTGILDLFVADWSPFMRIAGTRDQFNNLLGPVVSITPTIDNANYLDYMDTVNNPPTANSLIPGASFISNGLNSDRWNQITQSHVQPDTDYKFSTYDDNFALFWPEKIEFDQNDNNKEIRYFSFKVNNTYIFQNVTGIHPWDITFKVGPQNLVYCLGGRMSDNTFIRHMEKDDPNDEFDPAYIFSDFVRNGVGQITYPPTLDISDPNLTLTTTDLSGVVLFQQDFQNHQMPIIDAITKEHFYIRRLWLNSVIDSLLPQVAGSIIIKNQPLNHAITVVGGPGGGGDYEVLLSNNERGRAYTDLWRVTFDGVYWDAKEPYASYISNTFDVLPWNSMGGPLLFGSVNEGVSFGFGDQEFPYYDPFMITDNDLECYVKYDDWFPNFKSIDETLFGNYWNPIGNGFGDPGPGAWELDVFNMLTGWTPGDDVRIDKNQIRLTGTDFGSTTGFDVRLYRNMPTVQVGETYIFRFTADAPSALFATGVFQGNYDLEIRHSGVFGQDGKEVAILRNFISASDEVVFTYDGFDAETRTNQHYKYTPSEVVGTNNPIVFHIKSSESSSFNWNSTEEPIFFALQGCVLQKAVTGSDFLECATGIMPQVQSFHLV